MKCSEFLKELNDYLDGVIDPKLQSELQEHLQWCHNCFVVCNPNKQTIEIYRSTEVFELPDDLRSRLQTAIVSKCKNTKQDH